MDRLSTLLKKYPIKIIMISVIAIVVLAAGIGNVSMATGNDTLVKSKTDIYKDNQMLEEEFGGEAIMVLYEADELLTPHHLKHMKGIEDELRRNKSIYTVLSPVTLVEEMAGKQADKFQAGISEIITGLDEMGSQLITMSTDMQENAQSDVGMNFPDLGDLDIPTIENTVLPDMGAVVLPDITLPGFGNIEFPEMDLSALNRAFTNMIMAQEKLGEGTENLRGGYIGFSDQLHEVGRSLSILSEAMMDSQEKEQLEEVGQKLSGLANQMTHISAETEELPTIPQQTIVGLNNIQEKLQEQSQAQQDLMTEQEKREVDMQVDMQKQQESLKQIMNKEQEAQQTEMKQALKKQQALQKENMQVEMEQQQVEKEVAMAAFQQEMVEKQLEQVEQFKVLSAGLSKMGENLKTMSENMLMIEGYADIMAPGLPTEQATLDNMIYDEDGKRRTMFEEVVIDDNHMMMMIKFNGNTNDAEKSDVVNTISTYLDTEAMDSVETIVSGKPVLDNGIRSSMQASIQQMMGIALLIMVVILFFVFKVRWRLLPLVTVLIAVVGTIGLMGWLNIPITMVSMAVFPILIGLGIDYAIQFQTRYSEEMAKEDSNE